MLKEANIKISFSLSNFHTGSRANDQMFASDKKISIRLFTSLLFGKYEFMTELTGIETKV